MDPIAVLQATSLFRAVPPEELVALSPSIRARTYPKGAFIFHQGDAGNALFIVRTGQVKIGRVSPRGEEVVFAVLRPGDSFGELGLLEPRPTRSADAQAIELSECLLLRRDQFLAFLDTHPQLVRRVIEILIGYLRTTDETFIETAFLDIPGRLASKLLELAESNGQRSPAGTRITLRLSQKTLAAMVAASRENVNRALSRFEAIGAIRREGGSITIVQPRVLRGRSYSGRGRPETDIPLTGTEDR